MPRAPYMRLLATAILAAGLLPQAACGPAAEPPRSAPRVLFDVAHNEIFGPSDTSPLGQSAAVQRIRDAGFEVEISRDLLTSERLKGAAGVVLAGPMRPFSDAEQDAIEAYLRQGGMVVLTIHIPYPHVSFAERFRVELTTDVVTLADPEPGADPGVLVAGGTGGELSEGVRAVTVLSGWRVEPGGEDCSRVAWTGPDTRIDGDDDGHVTPADPAGPFGMVVVAQFGAGRLVVAGDDAIFANAAIARTDNARLLDNILRLMAERTKSV